MAIQLDGIVENFNGNLWGYHVKIPPAIADAFVGDDGSRRVVCTINGAQRFQCAIMPRGEGVFFVMLNKKIRDSLGLEIGSSVKLLLEADESQYGLPMPEELAELLAQDEEGAALFEGLTPGKKRTLIYIVSSVKNPESRLRRALILIEHLRMQSGKIDFKRLNQELKQK